MLLDCSAAIDARGGDGKSPLHWASHNGYAEIVEILGTLAIPFQTQT